jgi:methionyl-tRNA synthetase
MREMVFGQDADFTDETFLARYNADLANDFGNLISRATTMIHKYYDGIVPEPDAQLTPPALVAQFEALIESVKAHAWNFQFSFALREIWEAIGATNRYIVSIEPWKIAKQPELRAQLGTTLYVVADGLRVISELLRPFIPGSAERALGMVGVAPGTHAWKHLKPGTLAAGSRLGDTAPLFPRIEQTVEELRTMADEQSTPTPAPPAAAPAAPAAAPATPAPVQAAPAEPAKITIDDFMKVELRVAKVLAAERVPKSNKLVKLQVDVGSEQRQLVAGIAEAYEPEALVGRTVVIVFNLKPAKLMGVESNGMVLAASAEGGKPMLVSFDTPPDPGTRVR